MRPFASHNGDSQQRRRREEVTRVEHLLIMFASNDDYGQNTGYSDRFNFDDCLDLDQTTGRPIRCNRIDATTLKIGRRKFPIISYVTWLGNMYWDGARVTLETANAIADYLRSTKKFAPSSGVEEVWDAWENGEPMNFNMADY